MIGVTPAVIGSIQETEVIKYIVGIDQLLNNRLLAYDGLNMRFTGFKLKRNPDCEHCGQPTRGRDECQSKYSPFFDSLY